MNPEWQSYTRSQRLVTFQNATGSTIPPHGLIELEGADSKGFIALKPRVDGCFCYVNGPVGVLNNGYGAASTADQVIIATNGTAAAGTVWGAKNGAFLAEAFRPGFVTMRAGSSGLVYAHRNRSTGGTGEAYRWIRITSATPDVNGDFPAVLLDLNSSGVRVSGQAIRFRIIVDAGTSVEVDGVYLGAFVKLVTISGVVYPVYDGPTC